MNLKHLTDKVLLKDIELLVREERACVTKVLHHLKEIEGRRLFADLKYASLFEYVVKELGYSEAAANRRIHSARLLRDLPEIEEKFERGELNLTTATMASQLFKQEGIRAKETKREILKTIQGKTKKEAEKALVSFATKTPSTSEDSRPLGSDSHALTFRVSEETLKKFERLKGLLASTTESSGEVVEYMLDVALREAEKRVGKLVAKPRTAPAQSMETRVPTAATKRAVFTRDRGRCRNCGGSYKLEYDHVFPYSLGGKTTVENLRLLCRSCNQRSRIKMKFSSA